MPSVEQLRKMLDESNPDPFVLYALAQEHAKRGEHGAAIEWFDRCLKVDRMYCYAYYHKARSQEAIKDVEGAKATLEAGVRAAREARDAHAESEIRGYLEMLE
jgi:tetratricopeptide (TPR) repeat protein